MLRKCCSSLVIAYIDVHVVQYIAASIRTKLGTFMSAHLRTTLLLGPGAQVESCLLAYHVVPRAYLRVRIDTGDSLQDPWTS